jgi:hypothetical protein
MATYPLLPQRRMGRRMRWKLVLLAVLIVALGLYDQFTGVLGPNWFFLWLALIPVAILWLYYALLMPRAAIQVTPAYVRLQGPLYGRKLSFKRIQTISPGKLEQHYAYNDLTLGERPILKPLHQRTCTFVELSSYPKAFKWRRWWFPRTLFGTRKKGLLCYVDDWMALSRELESARARRLAETAETGLRRKMTPAAYILAEDYEFD